MSLLLVAAHEFDAFCLFLPYEQVNLKKGLSLDASSKAPVISFDGQPGKLDTDLSSPAINGNLPNLSVNKPSLSVGSQYTKPSFGITGPKVQGGSGGSLKTPEVSAPQLKAPSASLSMKNPDVKTGGLKYETPKFSMPSFSLPQINPNSQMGVSGDADLPSVNLDVPNLNLDPNFGLEGPKAGLSRPNLNANGTGVNLHSPDLDIEGHSSKFKWPHKKWKGPKGKGLDADLSAPDLSVSTPGVKANVDTPVVDLNAPRVDIQTPGIEADPPSGKIMWPHLKWKKPKGPNAELDLDPNLNTPELTVPKLESNLSGPDMDLKVPKAELKGPDVDVQTPNVNMESPSGKINWPHLKWKKPRGSKAGLDLDADLNTPDLNLSAPHLKGEMNPPNAELELPKAGANMQMPDADIDASGKINWPHLKWKKPKVHGPKADVDLNADLSAPDVDVSVPNVDLNAPDASLSLPNANADINSPNLDVDPPKFKWPTLKKPKIKKDHNLDFGADISAPDLGVNKRDLNLNMPKANLESPELDVSAPDIDGPSGKFKWLNFKKPKFGTLKGPKADLDADLKAPDVDLKGPDVDWKMPGIDLSTPKVEGQIGDPDLNVGVPDLNLSGAGVDSKGISLHKGKLNSHEMKLPNFSSPTFKGPELDAKVKAPSIDANPDVNLKAPNLPLAAPGTPDLEIAAPSETGNLHTPARNLDMNLKKDITAPNAKLNLPDLNLSGPKKGLDVGLNGDLSAPSLSIPTTGDLKVSDVNLNMEKPDLETPELDLDAPDIEGPSGKFKWFNFKKPKIGTLKGEKAQIDSEVKVPDVDLKGPDLKVLGLNLSQASPELNGNISLPDVDATLPKGDLTAPGVSVKAPKMDLNGPGAQLQTENGAFDPDLGDFKVPQLQTPAVQAGVEGPKINPGRLDGSIAAAAPDVRVKTPKVSTPDVDGPSEYADGKITPKGKLNWPFKWGFKSASGKDEEGNGGDSETEATNDDIPPFKMHKLPEMNLDSPAGIRDAFILSRQDTETKDYVMSKGIRLPVVNSASKPGEKVNVFERLQMAKENLALSKRKSIISLGNMESGASTKVDPPGSGLSLVAAEIPALNDNDKLSFGLSNMLGLNVKDSDAN